MNNISDQIRENIAKFKREGGILRALYLPGSAWEIVFPDRRCVGIFDGVPVFRLSQSYTAGYISGPPGLGREFMEFDIVTELTRNVCECGAEKLGHPNHSQWCNAYQEVL